MRALLFNLALLMTAAASAETTLDLRVRASTDVREQTIITLAKIVETSPLSAGSQALLERAELHSPLNAGESFELTRAQVLPLLRAVVENERHIASARLNITVPEKITVTAKSHELSEANVSAELKSLWQPLCMDCRLRFENLSLPRVDGLRDWSLRAKAELPRGSFSIPVELIRANGSPLPAWISGRVVIERKVPVARKMMTMGERLAAQDVAWEYRDTALAFDGLPQAEELVGKRMRQGIRAGEILWRSLLEKEKALHRGELVQVRTREAGWEVSMSLVSQQDAYLGDVVTLKNAKTGNSLTGEVVAPGEVELR